MPVPSPFHERTIPLCTSYAWKEWAGYLAVRHYGPCHLPEYFAFRQSAGLLDVSPLFKYEVRGKDAARFLARVMVRDITKLKVGRVTYTCWCDGDGKVIDDGTVSRLDEDRFFVTAADPSLLWLERLSRGYEVEIQDVSEKIAALALQGPTSRDILKAASDADLDALKFFCTTAAKLGDVPVRISRTGFTGDLGYEVWVERERALEVWDALMDAGRAFQIRPAGLDALDMARVEAGFILLGVDYFSAPKCVLESRKSTPFEIGLGFTVDLERAPFMGQAALLAEKERGSVWQLVGVEAKWEELFALYERYRLPPRLLSAASREAIPLYAGDQQVGQVTSSVWSPVLKKLIGIASVKAPYAALGTELQLEHTVEYERRTVTAVVVNRPFFDPERKRKP